MLKLIALDAEDLAVISTHVQDARIAVEDIVWRPAERRLVIGLDRLDWEQALSGEPASRRVVAALRFDRVMACKSRNVPMAEPRQVLELVGIEFHASDAPAGSVVLLFRDGGALRAEVECLECQLTDLGNDDLGLAETKDAAAPDAGDAEDAPGAEKPEPPRA